MSFDSSLQALIFEPVTAQSNLQTHEITGTYKLMDVDATIALSYTATADCAQSWKAASGFTNTYVPGLVAIDASDTITLEAELVDDTEGITWSNSCGLATEYTLEADVDKCGAAAGDSLANCPFITISGNVITISPTLAGEKGKHYFRAVRSVSGVQSAAKENLAVDVTCVV